MTTHTVAGRPVVLVDVEPRLLADGLRVVLADAGVITVSPSDVASVDAGLTIVTGRTNGVGNVVVELHDDATTATATVHGLTTAPTVHLVGLPAIIDFVRSWAAVSAG